MELPAWFRVNGNLIYNPPPDRTPQMIRLLFIDRTLRALTGILKEFIQAEVYVQKQGMLQGLDPRGKLMGILLLIGSTSLLHFIPLLFALYGLTLILALLSRIDPAFFLKRVLLVLPLFGGIIALPATLNIFTPGEAMVTLFSLGKTYQWGPYFIPSEITLTRQGISTALLLVGRIATSLSLVLLLTLTTPWAELLKALRSARVPTIYVQTLGMALRYLILLSRVVEERHLAKKSRTIRLGKPWQEQRWIAGEIGALFKRSMQISGEVHRAMAARGYQGEVHLLNVFRFQKKDYYWAGFCASLAGILIYFGR